MPNQRGHQATTPQDLKKRNAKIVQLYNYGVHRKDIASRFGLNPDTVSGIIREMRDG